MMQKKDFTIPGEEESERQYRILVTAAEKSGFEHYEISNFARDRAYSRHNTSYWTGKKYLGIGPSAHSFDGRKRRWNHKGIMSYIRNIREGQPYYEQESLDTLTVFNEYIMTGLRTMWGIDLSRVQDKFGERYHKTILEKSQAFIRNSTMVMDRNKLVLTEKGRFIADYVIRELFMEGEAPD
jgi:oxygen-independent coproporphyrinogen-3 oxidase